MLLKDSACKFITAQQFGWWLKGGEGKLRGGRKGGGEAVGPALPALGPALASNCNSSSGRKVSSAWLPLTSPKSLPLCPLLYPLTLFNSVFFSFDTPLPELISSCKSYKLIAYQVVTKDLICLLPLSSEWSPVSSPLQMASQSS